jgi:hypothetical protein
MAQAVRHRLLAAEARVQAKVSPRAISGGQIVSGTGLPPSTCPFSYRYNFTYSSYSVITHRLYNTITTLRNSQCH